MEGRLAMERGDRPWGYYLVLLEDAGYKVKQIVVKQGSRLASSGIGGGRSTGRWSAGRQR